jgi:hypothetical protein
MTDKIINLFSGQLPAITETPGELLTRLLPNAVECNMGLVVLINQRGGSWQIDFYSSNMSNGETILACEIIRDRIMKAVLEKED